MSVKNKFGNRKKKRKKKQPLKHPALLLLLFQASTSLLYFQLLHLLLSSNARGWGKGLCPIFHSFFLPPHTFLLLHCWCFPKATMLQNKSLPAWVFQGLQCNYMVHVKHHIPQSWCYLCCQTLSDPSSPLSMQCFLLSPGCTQGGCWAWPCFVLRPLEPDESGTRQPFSPLLPAPANTLAPAHSRMLPLHDWEIVHTIIGL